MTASPPHGTARTVAIAAGGVRLDGELALPPRALGVVLFAHGSGSSRHSPRNQHVAQALRAASVGTLLFDLLTADEDCDQATRFDIPLLTARLAAATGWVAGEPDTANLPIGYFGASTGAAAALAAAAQGGARIAAVVSRGGRPDLAGSDALSRVLAPTLLIVGGWDDDVLALNRAAYAHLRCPREIKVVPGATHLFEEPGALDAVAAAAADWFTRYLGAALPAPGRPG